MATTGFVFRPYVSSSMPLDTRRSSLASAMSGPLSATSKAADMFHFFRKLFSGIARHGYATSAELIDHSDDRRSGDARGDTDADQLPFEHGHREFQSNSLAKLTKHQRGGTPRAPRARFSAATRSRGRSPGSPHGAPRVAALVFSQRPGLRTWVSDRLPSIVTR